MKKRKWIVGAAVCWLAVAACFFCGCEKEPEELLEETETGELFSEEFSEKEETRKEIVVHICGQVKNPGLYRAPEGIRYGELLELCGGSEAEADLNSVNLARIAADGEQIYIPAIGEEISKTGETADGRVDLNTADAQALMALPGIGQAKADAILLYRKEHGPFSSIEELKKVPGIKDALFSKVKALIYVSGTP